MSTRALLLSLIIPGDRGGSRRHRKWYFALEPARDEAIELFETSDNAVVRAKALAEVAHVEQEQSRLVPDAFGRTEEHLVHSEDMRQSSVVLRLVALTLDAEHLDVQALADDLTVADWLTEDDDDLVEAIWPALTALAGATDPGHIADLHQFLTEQIDPVAGTVTTETAEWLAQVAARRAGRTVPTAGGAL